MWLAYIDESGNTGPISAGGSLTYTLGCVLLDSAQWPTTFDGLLALRRNLRNSYGLLMRTELKANWLIRNGGDLRRHKLAPGERRLIYRAHLRALAPLNTRAFAVVIDKRVGWADPFDVAWETLLQRLERTSAKTGREFMVIHDEGENDRVRAWVRRARRHLTAGGAFGGTFTHPARRLVDDPVPRNSQHSYVIQVADLVAYAAFRSVVAPSASIAQVCPQSMWSELGAATHVAVSGLRPRAAPGIVLR